MPSSRALAFLFAFAALAPLAGPALATPRGGSGKIVYQTLDPRVVSGECEPNCYIQRAVFVDGAPVTFPVIGDPNDSHAYASFSPDGSRITFVKPGASVGDSILEMMGVDGSNLHPLVDSAAIRALQGIAGSVLITWPSWSPDGAEVAFNVESSSQYTAGGIFSVWPDGSHLRRVVGNASSIEQTTFAPSWSPVGKKLAYKCRFQSQLTSAGPQAAVQTLRDDLCVLDLVKGSLLPIAINLSTTYAYPNGSRQIGRPTWTTDGQRILFHATFTSSDYYTYTVGNGGGSLTYPRSEIFSVRADGSALKKLTYSPPMLISPYIFPPVRASLELANPVMSPDGASIAAYGVRNASRNGNVPGKSTLAIWTLGADGQGAAVRFSLPAYFDSTTSGLDWQRKNGDLIVAVTDGHGHYLSGLEVKVCTVGGCQAGSVVAENPSNASAGVYVFETIPAGEYVVRVRLTDTSAPPGASPAFDVRNEVDPNGAAWVERKVTIPAGAPSTFSIQNFTDDGALFGSSVPNGQRDRLDDLGAIYWRVRQFVDWAKLNLQSDMGDGVPILAFVTELGGSPVDADLGAYHPFFNVMLLGTEFSKYEVRDGVPDAQGRVDSAPENGEWHEFTHFLSHTFVHAYDCDGSNHAGYSNPSSCDSLYEGLATFVGAYATQGIEGVADSHYDGLADLEQSVRAWQTRRGRSGAEYPAEDIAAAALLWDLIDTNADVDSTKVIGNNGTLKAVDLTDAVSMGLGQLWSLLKASHIANVSELHDVLSDAASGVADSTISMDLDGQGTNDVSKLDIPFLMHGFYAVAVQQDGNPGLNDPYYDVAGAQHYDPILKRNAWVGRTDHYVQNSSGAYVGSRIPRYGLTVNLDSLLEVSIQDQSGTPISGASIEITERPNLAPGAPGAWQSSTLTVPLEGGTGVLVHYEAPFYNDWLLPPSNPPPVCDAANDVRVNVTVVAKVNGYTSVDQPVFDNCAFWQTVFAGDGSPAASYVFHFAEDSLAPLTSASWGASEVTVGNRPARTWFVDLDCNDPVQAGFASGCHHIEYRIDGGALHTYLQPVVLDQPGLHLFEYRSIDRAGNQEAFHSLQLAVEERIFEDDFESGDTGAWSERQD